MTDRRESAIAWVAVDWGSSNMRLWAMSADHDVVDTRQSAQGAGQLSAADFASTLREALSGWSLPTACPVIACGMVGARQGWVEAPYQPVPTSLPSASPLTLAQQSDDWSVWIVGGLSQAAPADVMRGEETQIAGYLSRHPGFDGVICLPGTHSKWAIVKSGVVQSFATAMTGELFALLAQQSVLRFSVADNPEALNLEVFREAAAEAFAQPQRFIQRLFVLRAADLLHGQSAPIAYSKLSGYCLGVELSGIEIAGDNIVIIGEGALSSLYQQAMSACYPGTPDVAVEVFPGDVAARAGLIAAYQQHLATPERGAGTTSGQSQGSPA